MKDKFLRKMEAKMSDFQIMMLWMAVLALVTYLLVELINSKTSGKKEKGMEIPKKILDLLFEFVKNTLLK